MPSLLSSRMKPRVTAWPRNAPISSFESGRKGRPPSTAGVEVLAARALARRGVDREQRAHLPRALARREVELHAVQAAELIGARQPAVAQLGQVLDAR